MALPEAFAPLLSVGSAISSLLGLANEECLDTMFVKRLILDGPCLKVFISKCLGCIMTLASTIVKTPIIKNILAAQSASGLEPVSMYLETVMYLSTTLYFVIRGDAFNEYGENVFLLLQNAIIVALMWHYTKTSAAEVVAVLAAFAAFSAAAFALPPGEGGALFAANADPSSGGLLPVVPCTAVLVALPMPLMLFSRLPQIYTNFRNGHTGIQSKVTMTLNTLGSTARVFTTLQKPAFDAAALATILASVALNFTLAAQCFAFSAATKEALKKEKAAQQKKKQ